MEVVIVVIGSVGKCVRETQGKNQKILIITKNELKNTYQLNDKEKRKIEMDFEMDFDSNAHAGSPGSKILAGQLSVR